MAISAVSGQGVPELMKETYKILKGIRKIEDILPAKEKAVHKIFKPHLKMSSKRFEIVQLKSKGRGKNAKQVFNIRGKAIEKKVQMANFNNEEGLERFYMYLEKSGIHKNLKDKGAKEGDELVIGLKLIIFRR